jgi:hypothetical protein
MKCYTGVVKLACISFLGSRSLQPAAALYRLLLQLVVLLLVLSLLLPIQLSSLALSERYHAAKTITTVPLLLLRCISAHTTACTSVLSLLLLLCCRRQSVLRSYTVLKRGRRLTDRL